MGVLPSDRMVLVSLKSWLKSALSVAVTRSVRDV